MSDKTYIPEHYAPLLNLYDTQKAISLLRRVFEDTLCGNLHLRRVSAPLFVEAASGLNDDLNGVERPVSFDIPAAGRDAQVVHSLAKWKRMALYHYHFPVGEGLVTEMNAIRRDEVPDNLHSIYVDQWDWEKVIAPRDRTEAYLHETVQSIVDAMADTQKTLQAVFPPAVRAAPGEPERLLRHLPGAGGHLPRPHPQAAGGRLGEGPPPPPSSRASAPP